MNAKTITSAIIAAVLSFSLGMPAIAQAGDRNHDRHGSGHSGGHRYKQDRHYKRDFKRHNKRQYGHNNRNYGHNKHHYKGYNNRHHYGNRGYGSNYYYDDDDDDDLLIGLVVGGILGYAINGAQQRNDYSYDRNAYSRDAYPATDTYSSGSCLQEREYQTTVVVGGRNVDAYGTACLQPDGSWKRSPPRVASY